MIHNENLQIQIEIQKGNAIKGKRMKKWIGIDKFHYKQLESKRNKVVIVVDMDVTRSEECKSVCSK